MKAQYSIMIAMLLIGILILSLLYVTSSQTIIYESTFIGVENPIWRNLDREIVRLAYISLRESSMDLNTSKASIIVGNWINIITQEGYLLITLNNLTLAFRNGNGYGYSTIILDINATDLRGNNREYRVKINATAFNFTLISTSNGVYNYTVTVYYIVNNKIYYMPIKEAKIYTITGEPRTLSGQNIIYAGEGVSYIQCYEEIASMNITLYNNITIYNLTPQQ